MSEGDKPICGLCKKKITAPAWLREKGVDYHAYYDREAAKKAKPDESPMWYGLKKGQCPDE